MYMRIADNIENELHRGTLRPGDRLPPQRELADMLGVTLGTVTRGYLEAEKRGLARGHTGRGTYITADAGLAAGFDAQDRVDESIVQLGLNYPLHTLDPPLSPILRSIAGRSGLEDLTRYVAPAGLPRHRQAASSWLTRFNAIFPADELYLTVGSQHALMLLVSTLLSPGDQLLCEELTYPGIKALAAMHGIRLIPAEMDEQGLEPESLDRLAASTRAKALYCMPPRHNPTTVAMSDERRACIADVARRRRLMVFEDATYDMPGNSGPAISNMLPELGFYVMSLSKCVAAGLRTGFLRIPPAYADKMDSAMTSTTWMSPPLMGEVMMELVNQGVADETVARKRGEANARNNLAGRIFEGMDIQHHSDSYFIWLRLPEGWQARDFCDRSKKEGVSIISAERFSVGSPRVPNAVRLSLSSPAHIRDLEKALTKLRTLLLRGYPPGSNT